MDTILQNWPLLLAGALGGVAILGLLLAIRHYYLRWRAEMERLSLIKYNRKQAIDCTVLVDAEAEVRPSAITRMASCVLDFGDWVRVLPFKIIDLMLGIAGRMASLVDPAVTRSKSLKERVKEERIAWRSRLAGCEGWLFRNPKALAAVTRGLEQSKAGQVVEYSPPLLDDIYTGTEEG